MHEDYKDYVKMLRKKWKPVLETSRVKRLKAKYKNQLAVLLENAVRVIDDMKHRAIFIPLTVRVFSEIAGKLNENGKFTVMTAPVDKLEDGRIIKAKVRRLEAIKVDIPYITSGIDADAELVNILAEHAKNQIFLEASRKHEIFAPYTLLSPGRATDGTYSIMTRYGTL